MNKKQLLEHMRERFEDELEFGGKSWDLCDLAEEVEMTVLELFDFDHDTGLIFQLQQDGEVSVYRDRDDPGKSSVVLNGARLVWE